jgi:DNA repair exonuclease SbcCD ATPase subunit
MEINNYMNIIDSRDVIADIEELETNIERINDEIEELKLEEDPLNNEKIESIQDEIKDLQEELDILTYLEDQAEPYCSNWPYGEILIKDSYFSEYAEELARDIGSISHDDSWPLNHIDWEEAVEELKSDYTQVDFDGEDYWIRSY